MTAADLDTMLAAFSTDLSQIVSFLLGGMTGLAFAVASSMRIFK